MLLPKARPALRPRTSSPAPIVTPNKVVIATSSGTRTPFETLATFGPRRFSFAMVARAVARVCPSMLTCY